MKEEWRNVVGWEGLYEVSTLGNVYSIRTDRILKGQRTGDAGGYLGVDLSLGGIYKRYLIHRLVAEAFIDNPSQLSIVNHIDGNKQNNTLDNLQWTTVAQNTQHAYDTGLTNGRRIPVLQYANGVIIARFTSVPEAAEANGVSDSCVRNVCGGFSKTCKGYVFEYERS